MAALTQLRIALDRISRALTLIGAYALLGATLLVVIEVVQRKIGRSTLVGADEISGYALAVSTGWAYSYALFQRGHIRLDVIHRLLPPSWRALLDVLATFSLFVLAVMLAYWGGVEFASALRFGSVANTVLRTPIWIPQGLWLSGLVLFAVAAGVAFLEGLLRWIAGDYGAVERLAGTPSATEH